MTQEGLSSVCAKLEPASSKNKEILEINVLPKFVSHALYTINQHVYFSLSGIKFQFSFMIVKAS